MLRPSGWRAVVGDGVVPATYLMHITASGEGSARRHADRGWGIGIAEPFYPAGSSPEEAALLLKAEYDRWKSAVRMLDFKPE
jgi:hypothetical protein